MTLKIICERISGGFCATVRDESETAISSAAMTDRAAAVAKAKRLAVAELCEDGEPIGELVWEVVDLS